MMSPSANEPTYGLGIAIEKHGTRTYYGHEGAYDGFEAELRYYPRQQVISFYAVNGNQMSGVSFLQDATEEAF